MFNNVFKLLFFSGWLAYLIFFGLRGKSIKQEKIIDNRRWAEAPYALLAFAGMQIIPIVYLFVHWFDFAEYQQHAWAGVLGCLVFAACFAVLWKAHTDLGRNWSPTLQIKTEHKLVSSGIYTYIQHPIYAAMWLWGIAQLLLLPNWVAGPLGLVCFLPVYLYRVRAEEQMMLEHFGEAYRAYQAGTGRVIPRWKSRQSNKRSGDR